MISIDRMRISDIRNDRLSWIVSFGDTSRTVNKKYMYIPLYKGG
jgi:hypothetical protein